MSRDRGRLQKSASPIGRADSQSAKLVALQLVLSKAIGLPGPVVLDQLDVKDERCTGQDGIAGPSVAISNFGGANETALTTFLHHLDALCPTLDDTVEGEGCWLATVDGTINDSAVTKCAVIVHCNFAGRGWGFASPFFQGANDQT